MTASRRTYGTLFAIYTALAVYASLTPFTCEPFALDQMVASFSRLTYVPLGLASRSDLVSNILLFVPFGFLAAGAAHADRRSLGGSVAAALAVGAVGVMTSVAVELTQTFCPPRTPSFDDVVADTLGVAMGISIWGAWGRDLTEWLRSFFRERERPSPFVRLLLAYAAVFLLVELLPLDVTIRPFELAQKYREGRIVLVPFRGADRATAPLGFGARAALNAPLGALTMLCWRAPGRRRSGLVALAVGVAVVLGAVLVQVFVFSRLADVTDVASGSMGVALGVVVSKAWPRNLAP